MSVSDYPAPRYVRFKKPKSIDEIMPQIRKLMTAPPPEQEGSLAVHRILKPTYNITAKDKVLFVVLSEYDSMVIEAMCRGIREKGAHVDVLTLDSTPIAPLEELAAYEAIAIGEEEDDYSRFYSMVCELIRTRTAKALVESEKYSVIISGLAGPIPSVGVRWYRFMFPKLYDFAASPWIDIPPELQMLIDKKVHNQVISCEVLRLTDPEGTDVRWTNYNDERQFTPGHIWGRPHNIGYGFGGKDDCTGVIAGTLNHLGAFPRAKAYIEGGLVVKVEGGGKYGDVWREKLEKYRNVKFPRLPLWFGRPPVYEIKDRGWFWYHECAIGTGIGVFRPPDILEGYANFIRDRNRAGYIHNGLGPVPAVQKELREAGLPWIHVHIHTMFGTLEGENKKGEKITIIDKGHLAALDDPEVRLLASKYGDPDELLKEAWVPAVPGINVPGDYMKDYAKNPIPWIKRELEEHPIWLD